MHARIAAGLCAGLSVATASAAPVDTKTLTLYQGGAALVTAETSAMLEPGVSRYALEALPQRMRFESLDVTSGDGARVTTLHRQPPTDVLARRVGKTVLLVDDEGGERRGRLIQLRGDGRAVVSVDDRLEVIAPGDPWRLVLPADAEPAREGIAATIDADSAGETPLAITYLTDGLDWQADYTLRVGEDGARLAGMATLHNDTGAGFDPAALLLVAGDVNDAGGGGRPVARELTMAASADSAPKRETAGDWHAYRLDGEHALAEGEQLRLPLMSPQQVDTERRYETVANANGWMGREPQPAPVTVRLEVAPDGERRPLPAGTVRVIDTTRNPAFFQGSDRIGHTPAGKGFDLTLGRAFDVRAERKQTAFERLGSDSHETAWEVRLTNAGADAVTVDVVERIAGDWKLLEASVSPAERDARHLRWAVEVPAEGETTLRYRVRINR
ncbi:DUF4139 domain-containing protein [Arhodomonas sp. AD133]|uniref:DUF4139 domain-containing protein n=1 Tax=Arhodomonas sp. AD133 TaxID=3415009 RepID=UPI003EB77ADB